MPRHPPSPDVYLLGAGFSRALSPEMPLLQDLADCVTSGGRVAAPIPRAVSAMMQTNFAHALSYLEQAKPWITEADNLRHRALFLEISLAIARSLQQTVTRVMGALGNRVPEWVASLVRHWHAHRCTVLSLNYDTLIETIAASVPVEHDRGLSAHQLYPPLLTDAGIRTLGATTPRAGSSFRLLKLHGSTNWYYSGRTSARGEPIYFVPPLAAAPGSPEQEHEYRLRMSAVADKYPFLVPPIYDKSALLTHETIRALWFEAGNALQQARRVICMGYSLPESDLTMRHFLRTTFRTGSEWIIVDPSRDAAANFAAMFRGAKIRVTSAARGRHSIARFVGSLG